MEATDSMHNDCHNEHGSKRRLVCTCAFKYRTHLDSPALSTSFDPCRIVNNYRCVFVYSPWLSQLGKEELLLGRVLSSK